MKLYTVCKSCKEHSIVKSNATDRRELIQQKGEEFNIQCSSCLKNHKIHVNDVRAKANKILLVGGLILSLIVTLFLWNYGLIGTISFIIPAIIWKQQSNATHSFNRYMTSRS